MVAFSSLGRSRVAALSRKDFKSRTKPMKKRLKTELTDEAIVAKIQLEHPLQMLELVWNSPTKSIRVDMK
ncbi:hypothetical protein V6N12_073813 [Hibiscus sabdariffa]|uniref:Uncharacterized protein n=1 Tax=Hibiscus sabdariffa TaxID=183260 RepID=A0ABR2BDE3_9ROSI